ncbi:hypothetical protein GALL_536810 [mine drainage metagenome]|uniref:Uncharacterized protein n=1 Tax=mine drainage metagenome TaxID=410659 RepID=A0A1J5PAD0_9ZZZZ
MVCVLGAGITSRVASVVDCRLLVSSTAPVESVAGLSVTLPLLPVSWRPLASKLWNWKSYFCELPCGRDSARSTAFQVKLPGLSGSRSTLTQVSLLPFLRYSTLPRVAASGWFCMWICWAKSA